MNESGNRFSKRYFLFDFARGRHLDKEETTLLLDFLQRAGYNGIVVNLECFFETEAYPGVIPEICLRREEAAWLCAETAKRGINFIPLTNFVGHAESMMISQERFADVRRDNTHNQMNLKNPELAKIAYTLTDELIAIFNPTYLYIGGDETVLEDEEKTLYVKFLSDLCGYISAKGIVPCLAGDMLYQYPETADAFTKDVAIIDWYYNGHRPASLQFFKEKGYREIWASPCDNGWNGFIGIQRRKAIESDVVPDEIEAFLTDAVNAGIPNALVCNYENLNGHNLWSNLSAIARAGLYLTGREISEESIENLLFGRITPYTRATLALAQIQAAEFRFFVEKNYPSSMRYRIGNALFIKEKYTLTADCAPEMEPALRGTFGDGLPRVRALLDNWVPQGNMEGVCKRALVAELEYAVAYSEMLRFNSLGLADYHEAALCQFSDRKKSAELLKAVAGRAGEFSDALTAFTDAQRAALDDCGQTKRDLVLLGRLIASVTAVRNFLLGAAEETANGDNRNTYVLPSWRKLIREKIQF